MPTRKTEPPRGLLTPANESMRHARYVPSADLAGFVEHYWCVAWDLRGQPPRESKTLPHPCVHAVFERGRSGVWGVSRGVFTRTLTGEGVAFGIKFRPGAFYPFVKTSVAKLTGKVLPLDAVLGPAMREVEREMFACADDDARITHAERFLRARLPAWDPMLDVLHPIVARVMGDREITRVDALLELFPVTKRTLQRTFTTYVGISPKWMIQRYRLHEAIERLSNASVSVGAGAGAGDHARIALELGYCDQSHFIRDFKSVTGLSPGEFNISR